MMLSKAISNATRLPCLRTVKSNFSPVAISVRSFGHHAEEKHASVSTVDAAFIESAKVIGEKISASPNFSSAYDAAVAEHGVEKAQYAVSTKGVVVPPIVDTLEWLLTSPPNVHQFEEPPIVVEIEHLKNLIIPEDV